MIKEYREHAGLSQRQFAELLGIPLDTVKNWDSGRRNPPEWVEKLIAEKLTAANLSSSGQKQVSSGKGQMYTELADGLVRIIGQAIQRIILYGSAARGTDTAESDVDIAIILREPIDPDTKDQVLDFVVDMNLKYDKFFSIVDINANHMVQWKSCIPFYQNVEQEGVVLWQAA